MPLQSGSSRETISKNISEMVHAGHPQRQAVAAALRKSREGDEGTFAPVRASSDAIELKPGPMSGVGTGDQASFERIRRAVASKADDPDALAAWVKRRSTPGWNPNDGFDQVPGELQGTLGQLAGSFLKFLLEEAGEEEHQSIDQGVLPLQGGGLNAPGGRSGFDRARDAGIPPEKPWVPGRANDSAPLASQRMALDKDTVRSIDHDGRLHIDSTVVSKAAVNPYRGDEIPDWENLGLNPDKTYLLLRHPDELARADTVKSFNNLPVLSKHQPVSADEFAPDLIIGSSGTDADFDSPHLTNSLVIWAAPAIAAVENGGRDQLSAAYRYTADMTPGVWQGQRFDGVMRNIKGNHIALVRQGRIGPDAVIGDESQEEGMAMTPAARAKLRTLLRKKGLLAQDQDLDETISSLMPLIETLTNNHNGGIEDQATVTEPSGGIPTGVDWGSALDAFRAYDAKIRHMTRAADAKRRLGRDETEEEREKREGEDAAYDQRMGLMPHLRGRDQQPPWLKKNNEEEEGEDNTFTGAQSGGSVSPAQPHLVTTGSLQGATPPEDMGRTALDERSLKVALDAAHQSWVQQQRETRAAERAVRPYVGDLAMAYDSAEQVYRAALEMLQVPDLDRIHPSAYPTILSFQRKASAPAPRVYVAQDSAAKQSLAERFPGIEKIRRI